MIHIILYNILISVSLIMFLVGYTINHCRLYWDRKYVAVPILTIITKFLFVIFFYYFSASGSNHDASTYYIGPVDWYPFQFGNHTMYIIGYFLRVYMHLSYFNSNLVLSVFAFFGLFFLLRCASYHYGENKEKISNYYLLLFFFPSIHFWCTGFAKETFVFFSVCWLCWKIFQQKSISFYKTILIILPVLFIRPHYVIFFVITIGIFNILKSKNKIKTILLFFPFIVGGTLLLIRSLDINFDGSFLFGLPELSNYIEIRREQNISQTMSFDINQFNSIELTLRFIFFPNLLDIFDISIFSLQSMLMIENTILLFFAIGTLINVFIKKQPKELIRFYSLVFFMLAFAFSASLITNNMGIVFRYKNMIYPVLIVIYLIMSVKKNPIISKPKYKW